MQQAADRAVASATSAPADDFLVFSRICDRWSLTADQQMVLLGSPSRSTFFKWRKEGGSLSQDTRERISLVVSIFKALEILFTDPDRSDGWVKKDNAYFDGKPALHVMLRGGMRDLYEVRTYLDAQRGG